MRQDKLMICLSVIIAHFKASQTLPRLFHSLSLALERVDQDKIEIIFVNNNDADDGSQHLVDDFSTLYPCVISTRESERGVAHARNKGMATSRGKYISFVDADDLVAPEYFVALLTEFQREPDLVVLSSQRGATGSRSLSVGDFARAAMKGWWAWQFVFRKQLAELEFKGDCYEDVGFFPFVISRCRTITLIDKQLYIYTENAGSLTKAKAASRMGAAELMMASLSKNTDKLHPAVWRRVKRTRSDLYIQLRSESGIFPICSLNETFYFLISESGWRDVASRAARLIILHALCIRNLVSTTIGIN